MSRADLAPTISLVGERPGVALASAVSNASSDSFSGVIPAYSAALGVTPELAAVVQDVAFAVMYRQAMTLTAEEALALAVSPKGIAFLKAAVADFQEKQALGGSRRRTS